MSWLLLILGVALWAGAHFFKRFAPDRRAAMGDPGKGAVALALVAAIVLMTVGYRMTDAVDWAAPPDFFRHINNLLILIGIYMMSPAPKYGVLTRGMRHPMLTGFALWAVAHLLVNWDPASVILFGGLLAWALGSMVVINAAEPGWEGRGPGGKIAMDGALLVAAAVLLGIIGWIHSLLGYWPFG